MAKYDKSIQGTIPHAEKPIPANIWKLEIRTTTCTIMHCTLHRNPGAIRICTVQFNKEISSQFAEK